MSSIAIEHEVTGPLKTNSYLIFDLETKKAAIFDLGGKIPRLLNVIKKNDLKVAWIFFTHGHFDHVMGSSDAKKLLPNAKLAINKKELDTIHHHGYIAKMFNFDPESFPSPDFFLEENQEYQLGNDTFITLLTPGHTQGSISFFFRKSLLLISGDVLFKAGVGRTDLYGGNFEQLSSSIKRLYSLPDNTKVLPGHGEATTIGYEKRNNPYV